MPRRANRSNVKGKPAQTPGNQTRQVVVRGAAVPRRTLPLPPPSASRRRPNNNRSQVKIGSAGTLGQMLTHQEEAITEYLLGLTTPGYPCKVPIVLGEFELYTNTYEYDISGTCVAGAGGVAYVGIVPDAWGDTQYKMMSYTGGTQGYPIWNSIANATTSPAVGAASGANDAKTAATLVDPAFTANVDYRMTSAILEVWSDAPAQTAQGDLCVAVVCGEQAYSDQALNGATYGAITKYPQNYVKHAEFPLAGWTSGEVVSAHLTPWSEDRKSVV